MFTVSRILQRNDKRRWMKKKGRTFLIRTNLHLTRQIDQIKKDVFEFCGQKVTAAFLFREGILLVIRALRVEMLRAKKGELHGKQRNDTLNRKLIRRR